VILVMSSSGVRHLEHIIDVCHLFYLYQIWKRVNPFF